MRAIAIIPARGGSRRIPRKNIRDFHGKPIIAYSIEVAQESGLFDGVWVSTEDREIEAVVRPYGAMVLVRSQRLAQDEIGTQEVVSDALGTPGLEKHEHACCIYPCAPLLTSTDLQVGFGHLHLSYAYVPGLYYWGRAAAFLAGVPLSEGYEVPYQISRYVDINTPEDFSRAEKMYAALHKGKE